VAYDKLKEALCNTTESRLAIIDMNKPFHLLVDSSDHTASGVLTQVDDAGIEQPIAFSSQKLNKTPRNWATVEKEAYAALSALRRYYKWVLVLRSQYFRTIIHLLILPSLHRRVRS